MMRAMKEWMGLGTWAGLAGAVMMAGCSTPADDVTGGGADAGRTEAVAEASAPERKSMPYVTPGLITEVDLQRVLELQDAGKLLLVDVRPPMFYAMGHLPEAISLPKKRYDAEFPKQKPVLDAAVASKKVIVLYCANVDCPDAYAVAKRLSPMGYAISLYKGGWDEWKMTGF